MPTSHYERLSGLDASFLALETREMHMHVAGVSIYEAGPMSLPEGGVDIDTMRRFVESKLASIPRYRQRLAWVPIERTPVWVDDPHFNIMYHVRHSSLPQPGTEEQLKEVTGRIISQHLDRAKPLWEIWIVEGLQGDRFALILKVHHCMIDGMSGVDIMEVLLNFFPTDEIDEIDPYVPRPAPSEAVLLASVNFRRVRDAASRARNVRRLVGDTSDVAFRIARRARAVGYSLTSGWLSSATKTPINDEVGPNRRFDWLDLDLAEVKEVKNRLGGTVNDVLLATVAGAVRDFLGKRDFDADELEFRAMAPVSVRSESERGKLGNQVAMWLVPLPIDEPDPEARYQAIAAHTQHLKETDQALGASTLAQVSTGGPGTLVSLGARLAANARPFNMTVTNVPGPQIPLYLLGSRLLAQYSVVPLWSQHGLGIALFSYAGTVSWGINADWDLVPDIGSFRASIHDAFVELLDVARAATATDEAVPDAAANRSTESSDSGRVTTAPSTSGRGDASPTTKKAKGAAASSKRSGTARKATNTSRQRTGAASAAGPATAVKRGAAARTGKPDPERTAHESSATKKAASSRGDGAPSTGRGRRRSADGKE